MELAYNLGMDKQIAEHHRIVAERLAVAKSQTDLEKLAHYHRTRSRIPARATSARAGDVFLCWAILGSTSDLFGDGSDGYSNELSIGHIDINTVCA